MLGTERSDVDLARYREVKAAGFDLPIPKPSDYGLSPDFSYGKFKAERDAVRRKAGRRVRNGALAAMVGMMVILSLMEQLKLEILFMCLIGCCIGAGLLLERLDVKISGGDEALRVQKFFEAGFAWKKQFDDWHECRTETGVKYWRNARGTEFERAVMRMLEKRGLCVSMTKGSGDGGIDLIVDVGSTRWLCQCKGHAKAISVAPVREIAGVCSRDAGIPVIFSANGFTKPALEAAHALGVAAVDGYGLVRMASQGELNHSEWTAHQS